MEDRGGGWWVDVDKRPIGDNSYTDERDDQRRLSSSVLPSDPALTPDGLTEAIVFGVCTDGDWEL